MSWKSIGSQVAKYAPLLGSLLPIPGAGVAGQLIAAALGVEANPSAVAQALATDPQAAVKIAQIEAANKQALQHQVLASETSRIQAVNKTMQAEASSEHWAQWMWRPYNGFLFGTTLFLVYALPTIINTFAPLLFQPVTETTIVNGLSHIVTVATWVPVKIASVPEFVFMAWGAVLGVSAWHRGKGRAAGRK